MKKNFISLLTCIIFSLTLSAQNNETCVNMEPFCLGTTYTSAAGSTSEPGNDYGCLNSQPNPSWYFLKTSLAGQIDLSLTAPSDIDFIIYGPFSGYDDILSNCGILGGINSPIVDCSYSGTNMETPSISATSSGEYYLLLVTNYANQVQDISLSQTNGTGALDCSVYNEAGYQSISGTIFYDEDQNGEFDNNDIEIPNGEFNISPFNYQGYTDINGGINYYVQTMDTINYSVNANYQGWPQTTSPNQYQFTLDTSNSIIDSLFFGFYPTDPIYSGSLDLINTSTQCVANTLSWINLANTGSVAIYANFEITLPNEIELLYSEYSYDSIINNTIYFKRDTLNIFENLNFFIQTQPLVPGSLTPSDTLTYFSSLNVFDTNENLISTEADSIVSLIDCSFDPNDKTSFPNGTYENTIIQPNEYLEYLIRFQNTGTAAAVTVKIEDTLSLNLDASSFQLLSSSHTTEISINEDRLLIFKFDNIMLPDSNSNELLSHGYVKYYIETVNGLLPNDSINNTAFIYFDYNEAVVTNTTHNIIDCYIVPPTADFSLTSNEIHSNLVEPNYSFLWLLNGDTIPNETNNFIPNMGNGEYTLLVSNEYNCETSTHYSLSLSIEEVSDISILIYPTPTESAINIEISKGLINNIIILEESGRLIKDYQNIMNDNFVIPENLLKPGFYFIKITNYDGTSITKRIIKI